jgi:hypothetical protein
MSIGFNKKDYAHYDSDDDSFSDEGEQEYGDQQGYGRTTKYNIPAEWVGQLCINMQAEAEYQALELFEKLTPDALATFLSEYSIDPYIK